MTLKFFPIHLTLVPTFSSLVPKLNSLLDGVKAGGEPVNAQGNMTPKATNAYATAYNGGTPPSALTNLNVPLPQSLSDPKLVGAKQLFTDLVNKLNLTQVGYLSGLNFKNPGDLKASQQDVIDSLTKAWDAASSAYAKAKTSDGDTARAKLASRLQEFDTAITSLGATPVKPDP